MAVIFQTLILAEKNCSPKDYISCKRASAKVLTTKVDAYRRMQFIKFTKTGNWQTLLNKWLADTVHKNDRISLQWPIKLKRDNFIQSLRFNTYFISLL